MRKHSHSPTILNSRRDACSKAQGALLRPARCCGVRPQTATADGCWRLSLRRAVSRHSGTLVYQQRPAASRMGAGREAGLATAPSHVPAVIPPIGPGDPRLYGSRWDESTRNGLARPGNAPNVQAIEREALVWQDDRPVPESCRVAPRLVANPGSLFQKNSHFISQGMDIRRRWRIRNTRQFL